MPARHFTDCEVALLTEQARGGVRRRDRLPRYSVPPQWQATTHNPENIRRHLRWLPRRSADGQQRAALRERVTGRGPGVWSAPSPRVTTEVHFSSPPVAAHKSSHRQCGRSSRGTALHKKTSAAAQRTGGHRRVATSKTTGGYPATKGTDPETELNGQWCHATATSGLHLSWCWFTHEVRTTLAPCIIVAQNLSTDQNRVIMRS